MKMTKKTMDKSLMSPYQNPRSPLTHSQTKRELAKRDWPNVEYYAEAKTEVVEATISRAAAARYRHDGVR
jgi:hypothetical protein